MIMRTVFVENVEQPRFFDFAKKSEVFEDFIRFSRIFEDFRGFYEVFEDFPNFTVKISNVLTKLL